MSSRSDAGDIIINTASSGRRKNVARNEKDGVTHNGAGVHPSSAAPDAKSTVAPMMVEKDSPPPGDLSNISNFPGNSNIPFMPPFQAPNAPAADPFADLLDYDNPLAPSTAPANNDNKGNDNKGNDDDDDDVTVRTPQLDDSKSHGSQRSNASRHSIASHHLLPSMFKICSNDNTVYVPETGGLICPNPKCNYLLCTACGDAAYGKQKKGKAASCPECKSVLKYDIEAEDAEANRNADIDLSTLMPAYQQSLSVLGKKLPKHISHTKLGLRKLTDAIILTNGALQEAEEELKDAQQAREKAQVITRLTLERDNASIAHRQAKLNEPYIKILKDYLEVQDLCKKAEKDFDKMRRNAENEQKLRVKLALAEIAAQDATMVDDVDTLLQEEEERREQRAAERRKRDAERYQAKKDRLRQRLLSVPPAVPPAGL